MITVSIMINGKPIFTRSARNIDNHYNDGPNRYKVDTGKIIEHNEQEGMVALGIKLLKTIYDRDL